MKTDFSKVIDIMTEIDAPESGAMSETERRIEEIEKRLTERLENTVNNAIKGVKIPDTSGTDTIKPVNTDDATDDATDTATDTANNTIEEQKRR